MTLHDSISDVLYALCMILQASLWKFHQQKACPGQWALLTTDEGHTRPRVFAKSVYLFAKLAINGSNQCRLCASCLANRVSFCWLLASDGGACAALTTKKNSPPAISPVVGSRGEGRGQKSCQLCPWGPCRLPPYSPCWETFEGQHHCLLECH